MGKTGCLSGVKPGDLLRPTDPGVNQRLGETTRTWIAVQDLRAVPERPAVEPRRPHAKIRGECSS